MDESTLLDLVGGRLDSVAEAAAHAHLAQCEHCRAVASWVGQDLKSELNTTLPPLDLGSPGEVAITVGATLGRYVVLERLGAGAMGVVYGVYDPQLDRQVALKFFRERSSAEPAELEARLHQEAKSLARLNHPNVVTVHDVGSYQGRMFVVMERVTGHTLSEYLADEQRPWRAVLRVLQDAGRGLHAAHVAGLVHRDFKPDNVLVGKDGRVRVSDFGLARDSSGVVEQLGEKHRPAGTPRYMAPEVKAGSPADARSDQYSFCLTLYEALYAQPPDREKLPRSPRAGVPMRIHRAVLRGLSEEPGRRFPTMAELLDAISDRPWRLTAPVFAAGAVLLVVVAAGVAVRVRNSALCSGAPARLVGVWDDGMRARVRGAFEATHLPYAAAVFESSSRNLDRFASEWTTVFTDACRATRIRGEQSEEELSLRMHCLDRRLRDVEALTRILAVADQRTVERAFDSTSDITASLDSCSNLDALRAAKPLPANGARQAEIASAQQQLTEARAWHVAGNDDKARSVLLLVGERIPSLQYAPLTAELLLAQGDVAKSFDEYDPARQAYQRAVSEAILGHADLFAVAALRQLAYIEANRAVHRDEAMRYVSWAQALLDRSGGDATEQVYLDSLRAEINGQQGQYAEAFALQQHVVAESMAVFGEDDPRTAVAYSNFAMANMMLQHYEEAEKLLRHTLAIREKSFGVDHPRTIQSVGSWCNLLLRRKQYAEARKAAERALESLRHSPEPRPFQEAFFYSTLGDLAQIDGHHAEAVRLYEETRARYEPIAAEHDNLAVVLASEAESELALHQPEKALPLVERALAILEEEKRIEPDPLARARFVLAQALVETHGDLAKARRAIEQAREGARDRTLAARIDAWLAHAKL